MAKLRLKALLLLLLCLIPTQLWSQSAQEVKLFREANLAFSQEKWADAAKAYRLVLAEKGTLQPFAWFNLGHCMVRLDKMALAAIAYRRSVESAPGFTKPYRALGDVYYKLQDPAKAMVWYRRALEVQPEDPSLFRNLGETALIGNNPVEALRWFDQARKLEPWRADVYFALADAHIRLKDWTAAIQTLQLAEKYAPMAGDRIQFHLSNLYFRNGQDSLALLALENGLLMNPKNSGQRRRLAWEQRKAGKIWSALFTLEEGIQYSPKDIELRLDIGELYLKLQRPSEAVKHFQAALGMGATPAKAGLRSAASLAQFQGDQSTVSTVQKILGSQP
jgi:tetratricopeptide (TPR) repeat protein